MPRRLGEKQVATADLFAGARFEGFGASRFHVGGEMPGGHRVRTRSATKLRARVKADAPRRPGVYGMLDARGRVIYIGKAKNLRARLLSYFRSDSRNPKAGRIVQHTRTLVWEFAETEFAALLRELELIQLYRPRYNVQGVPGRQRYFYVCVGRSNVATCYVAHQPAKKDRAIYGPFVGRSWAELAVRRLNDAFRLRDCASTTAMTFADQSGLFELPMVPGCIRVELGTCLGPCAGYCTRRGYGEAVRRVRAFLDGRDRGLLAKIQEQMENASAAMAYEKAAAFRDKLRDLTWLDQRLTLLRRARDRATFVLPCVGHGERPFWFVVHRGLVVATLPVPSCEASRAGACELLEAISAGTGGREAVDSVLLVAGWLRKNAADRDALRPLQDVLLALREPGG